MSKVLRSYGSGKTTLAPRIGKTLEQLNLGYVRALSVRKDSTREVILKQTILQLGVLELRYRRFRGIVEARVMEKWQTETSDNR